MELFESYWSFLAVGVLVYLFGLTAKRFICRWWPIPASAEELYSQHPGMRHPEVPTMRSLYDAMLPWLPVLGGFALGLVPLPIPDWVATTGDTTATIIGRCFWFSLAGALCGQLYEAIQRLIRAKVGGEKLRDSAPPVILTPAPSSTRATPPAKRVAGTAPPPSDPDADAEA